MSIYFWSCYAGDTNLEGGPFNGAGSKQRLATTLGRTKHLTNSKYINQLTKVVTNAQAYYFWLFHFHLLIIDDFRMKALQLSQEGNNGRILF